MARTASTSSSSSAPSPAQHLHAHPPSSRHLLNTSIQLANHLPSLLAASTPNQLPNPNPSSFYSSLAAPRALAVPPPLRLTHPHPDESTRVQLHRQQLREKRASAIVAAKSIPGFRTSAAFFASLRTNLRLHASPPPSPMSTPPSMRGSTTSLPPPSPLSAPVDSNMGDSSNVPETPVSTQPEDALDGVPELKTYMVNNDDEKISALKLTADSIAQMRQSANSALIYSPINLSIMVAFLALAARFMRDAGYDNAIIGTTGAGLVMCTLAIFRWFTQDYLFAAEAMKWDWLGDADVIVTKFGDEIIGTVIIDWLSGESRQKRKKAWRGEIKAWTVRLKYRHKGVGTALLEEAVKEAKKKGAETLEFAEEHANSKRVLYSFYNKRFDNREQKGRDMLQDLFDASPVRGKKK
ncbi:Hypothetical protein R9X50_00734500 [Acrodontium crateriforme]|uniref:N-acetyltransferase domain-containing protein n=1 Tax=Acrodontium crateriforme TaxID=150365 RepID=A0AAQ3RAP2_9PEZI|nr:Hypothetical protein R9X50_00734500 [Acrodontium crateriforme]